MIWHSRFVELEADPCIGCEGNVRTDWAVAAEALHES